MEFLVKAAEQHTTSNMMPINTNDDEKVVDEIDGFTISAFNEKPVQRIEQQNCTSIQISRDISEDVSEDISQEIPDKLKDVGELLFPNSGSYRVLVGLNENC